MPIVADQDATAGTLDIVASKDGRYISSTNEYGVIDSQRGNVAVTSTGIDSNGYTLNRQQWGISHAEMLYQA